MIFIVPYNTLVNIIQFCMMVIPLCTKRAQTSVQYVRTGGFEVIVAA